MMMNRQAGLAGFLRPRPHFAVATEEGSEVVTVTTAHDQRRPEFLAPRPHFILPTERLVALAQERTMLERGLDSASTAERVRSEARLREIDQVLRTDARGREQLERQTARRAEHRRCGCGCATRHRATNEAPVLVVGVTGKMGGR